ncbi:MAG: hypothetical protein U0871_12030 [Gemmataceae bacterium]
MTPREQFRAEAVPILFADKASGATVAVRPKEWHSGPVGWGGSATVYVRVGGRFVKATAVVRLTVEGSGRWE